MFSSYLLFVSLLIINWTFPFMYKCICGRTIYLIIYVKSVRMCDLQIMLNCKLVSLCLELLGLCLCNYSQIFMEM